MSSSCPRGWTPDVFVSSGNDDGGNPRFKQALFNKLKQSGIGFRDTKADGKEAIRQARFALVLLSTKYTDDKGCLDELVEILNRRGESVYPSLVVIPIFPEPAQVLNIGKNLVGDRRENKWKWALTEVGKIPDYYKLTAGANSDERDKLIRTIIKRLVKVIQSLYSYKVFGPFGGEGEIYWHSGEIKGKNAFDELIKSINFKVQRRRTSNGREARLEDPWKKGERITQFSGYLGKATVGRSRDRIVIESLVFRTNEGTILETIHGDNRYAGNREDFSVPSVAGEFLEFFCGGTKENRLTSIGARAKLTRAETPSKRDDGNAHTTVRRIGAHSYGGGKRWFARKHKGVKEIYLSLTGDNCYIKFVYDVDGTNGCEVTHPEGVSPKINEKKKISLTYSGEYFTSISSYTRDDGSIQALTFYTNRKRYAYGNTNGGKYFGYPSTGTNKIVGFYGTWGNTTLNSIGADVEPIFTDPPTVPFGPFPVGSGNLWDDGKHSHVVGYRVTANKDNDKIESITFMYYDNGSLVEGSQHGGGDPSSGEWVMLNFPEERLTSLSGYWRKDNEQGTIIHNLQLHTVGGRISPLTYAKRKDLKLEERYKFKIPNEPDKDTGTRISGFFGKAGKCLNSIGAYVGHY